MSRPRVFIDGHVGTTGLRIRDWMAERDDLEVVALPDDRRKDPEARRELLADVDLAILCLPDDAAREAVAMIDDDRTKVVDASTAHRVAEGWAYGVPEISASQREAIREARFVSNPGCYPISLILTVGALVDEGLVPPEAPISIHALSGYSGGGKALIEKWQDDSQGRVGLPWEAPYALEKRHKHIPEMMKYGRLEHAPHFVPAVGPFRCGMRVEIPLHASVVKGDAAAVHAVLAGRYQDERFVDVAPLLREGDVDDFSFDPQACNDTNRIRLSVVAHPDGHVLLVGVLDNLGKGASGSAIQCLNLMLGLDEGAGLPI